MKKLYSLFAFLFLATLSYAQGTWHVQTPFGGSSRYRAASFVVNGMCYVGTGSTGGGISQNLHDLWEFDPVQNIWSQKADLSAPSRTNATGASDDTYGYIGLGSDNGTVLSDWWQYNPVANTWMQKSSFPGTSRYGAGTFTIQNRIYVGGGIDSINVVYSDFYAYEATGDVWVAKQSLPTAVTSMAAYVIDGKGYFVAGAVNGGITGSTQNAEYDPIADTWTTRAPFGGGNNYSCVGFVIDNIGYVGTGLTNNLTNEMYSFDPLSNMWTQETNFPNGIRQWAVSCSVNNRGFMGTGNSTGGNLFNDWWEFVPVITGIKNNATKLPIVSFDAASHQILVRDAKGTEDFQIYSIDGKLILNGNLEKGNNLLYVQNKGVFFVRLNDRGNRGVTKIVSAE